MPVSYIAVDTSQTIDGIRGGSFTLSGTGVAETVSFSSLSTTDYTIIVWNPNGLPLDISGMNASKTASSFEVVSSVGGAFRWAAFQNEFFDNIRSGTSLIEAGVNNVFYSTSLNVKDYTLFIIDTQNTGNIYGRAKGEIGFNINCLTDTEINYVAILN